MTVWEAKFLSKKIMESNEIPLLVGHFGVGKTDIAREIAQEAGRDLVILVLSQMEPGDLLGLPVRDEKEGKTKFLAPDWWPEDGNTIIMLDEINRAHRSIRNAIMQLLVDKRIHNHKLPEGTWIMASMNPPEEDYDQVELITDPAFLSRFFILEITPTVEEWIRWAKETNVHENVVEFISKFPEFLTVKNFNSLKKIIKPSPRSWVKLSNVLKNLSQDEKEKFAYVLAAGIVGPESAKVFVDNSTLVDFESPYEILVEGKIPSEIDFHKANSLLVRIVDFINYVDDNELDKLQNKISTIAQNFIRFSKKVPSDSAHAFLRMLIDLSSQPGKKGEFSDNLLREILRFQELTNEKR